MNAIIKLSSLGDIIHSTIVLPLLNEKIDFIVDNSFAEILDYNPYINKVIPISLRKAKNNKKIIVNEIKKVIKLRNSYNNIYDLQGLLKSAIIGKILSKNLIGYKNPRERIASLFYHQKIQSRKKYAIERYLELFGIDYKEYLINHPPLLFYEPKEFSYLSNNKQNIVFIIGATWKCKKYPKEHWAELANLLKENIIIPYYSKEEEKEAFYIANFSSYVIPVKLTLNELKALISKSDLVIGNDTGPSFIAWANNIKNIILYGCTYNNKIIENKFSKSIEIQQQFINKNLSNQMHKITPFQVMKKIEEFK